VTFAPNEPADEAELFAGCGVGEDARGCRCRDDFVDDPVAGCDRFSPGALVEFDSSAGDALRLIASEVSF
jgi:hypothetical protein